MTGAAVAINVENVSIGAIMNLMEVWDEGVVEYGIVHIHLIGRGRGDQY